MTFRRAISSLGLCALLPLLGGCYRYAPARLQDVRPGANVRAYISAVEADRIAPAVTVDGARRVHAVLLQADTAGVLLEGFATIREAAEAVREGQADSALPPIENTTAGSINETYDLLAEGGLTITAEAVSRIEHCLLGLPGSMFEDLRQEAQGRML